MWRYPVCPRYLRQGIRDRLATKPAPRAQVYGSDGTGNVSTTAINAQIAELNENFAGQESSAAANTEFSFTLQAVRRHQNDAWFYDPDTAAGEQAMKTATHEGDARTLNIWSTNTGYLGYATAS